MTIIVGSTESELYIREDRENDWARNQSFG